MRRRRRKGLNMAKKMTAKEFWGILEEAGFSSDRDFERILNIVSLECRNDALTAYKHGCPSASDHCKRIANKIHDALDARGYYNDVK